MSTTTTDIFLADMRACQPRSAMHEAGRADTWRLMPYEAEPCSAVGKALAEIPLWLRALAAHATWPSEKRRLGWRLPAALQT
jgi:hypothetical protein